MRGLEVGVVLDELEWDGIGVHICKVRCRGRDIRIYLS